jgi:hypothetical protein
VTCNSFEISVTAITVTQYTYEWHVIAMQIQIRCKLKVFIVF